MATPPYMSRARYPSAIAVPSTPDRMDVDITDVAGAKGYATPTSPNAPWSKSQARSSRAPGHSHFAFPTNRDESIPYAYPSPTYDSPPRSRRNVNTTSIPTPSPSESPGTPLFPLPNSHSTPLPLAHSLPSPNSLSTALRVPPLPSFSPNLEPSRVESNTNSTSKKEKGKPKRKHIALNHPSHPRTNPAHIPRPRNAFILFRSYALSAGLLSSSSSSTSNSSSSRPGSNKARKATSASAQLQPSVPLQQNEASREIAKIWRGIDDQTRALFEEMAREEKRKHREMYPDYRYAPRKLGGGAAVSQHRGQEDDEDEDDDDKVGMRGQRRKGASDVRVAGRRKAQTEARKNDTNTKSKNVKKGRAGAPFTPATTPETSPYSPRTKLSLVSKDEEDDDGSDSDAGSEYEPSSTRRLIGRKVGMKSASHKTSGRSATEEDIDATVEDLHGLDVDEDEDESDDDEVLTDLRLPGTQVQGERSHPEFTLPSHSSFASTSNSGSTYQNANHLNPSFNVSSSPFIMPSATSSAGSTQRMTSRPPTINPTQIPLLAQTAYYAPSFIHTDRTHPQPPISLSSANFPPESSNPDPNNYSESKAASALEEELNGIGFSCLTSGLYDEESEELFRRAVKPIAPLWLPFSDFDNSHSEGNVSASGSNSTLNPNFGKDGVDWDAIRAEIMHDLDMSLSFRL